MDYGWFFLMLRDYRAGRVSLGTFAHKLDVPLSEAIDLLAELGVRSPLEYDDYLKGLSTAMAFEKPSKEGQAVKGLPAPEADPICLRCARGKADHPDAGGPCPGFTTDPKNAMTDEQRYELGL